MLILVLTHFARFLCSAARMIYVCIDVYLYLRVYVRNCRYVRKAFVCKACFLRDVVGWSRIFWNLQEFYVYVCVYVYVNVYVYVHLYLYAYIQGLRPLPPAPLATSKLVTWLTGWLADWLAALAGWLAGCLAGLAGWLAGWLGDNI